MSDLLLWLNVWWPWHHVRHMWELSFSNRWQFCSINVYIFSIGPNEVEWFFCSPNIDYLQQVLSHLNERISKTIYLILFFYCAKSIVYLFLLVYYFFLSWWLFFGWSFKNILFGFFFMNCFNGINSSLTNAYRHI